ncbi:MAG: hypothetical protein GF375_06220 [Candidatus Omnitrophica bacterium]|nr:hypothetical protein [Candidatus Omnitrophota bacterium]MBD3269571.1 hypothetical protein [Candidatus Omnitrophota bacterium]
MKVDVKKLNKIKLSMRVEVEGEEFQKEKEQVYRECSKNLKVPGFRPGTAPMDVLEKHHPKILKEEFLKKSLPQFYQKALDTEDILPASLPKIHGVEVLEDSFSFSADLEVRPEVEVSENVYKGIKIKDKKVKVEGAEIEKVLTNLKEGIKKVTGRDLDDNEIARWASYPEVSELREAVKAQLFMEKSRQRRQDIENQLKTHLLKSCKIDLPAEQVEQHRKELLNREMYNLRMRGVPEKDIEKYKKDVDDKLKPIAEEDVKLYYILEAIAKKEEIKNGKNLADKVFGFLFSQAKYG